MNPAKLAVFDENDSGFGLRLISFVENPAIGFVLIQMAQDVNVQLSIENEEQQIIFTPVLIPMQRIQRTVKHEDGTTETFDLIFDKETIKKVAIKWSRDQLSNAVDINHSEKLIPGVTFFESFIKGERVKSVIGYDSLPDGTWFISGKVSDPKVWQLIKDGKIKGVSIDGMFKAVSVQRDPVMTDAQLSTIMALYK
jgi:hypothetical protein